MNEGPASPRSLLRSPLYLGMVARVALVVLIPAVVTSVYNLQRSSAARLEASQPQLLQATEAKATAVEAILLRSIGDVLLLGQAPPVQRYALALALTPTAPPRDVNDLFHSFLRRSGGLYDGVSVLDRTGREQVVVTLEGRTAQTTPDNLLRSRTNEALFSGAMSLTGISGRQPPVYLSPVTSARPGLRYASPLFAIDGSVAGVLVISAPLEPLLRPLSPDAPGDHVFLVDSSGDYLASAPGATGSLRAERPEDAGEILGRPHGTLLDTANRPGILQAFARIRPTGQGTLQWTVVSERPLAAILAPEREIELVILATTAGSLVLALLLTLLFVRGLVGPIHQLALAASSLREGHWDTPLPTTHRRDELGALTGAFSEMGRQLRVAWHDLQQHVHEVERSEAGLRTAKEALRQAHDELEQRVQERTQELREAHLQLMEAARVAGREEIATTILHNVGNVLSSVNVSASILEQRLRQSRVSLLGKVTGLLKEHQDELGRFLTEDPKGKLLPEYLTVLAEALREENTGLLEEVVGLERNLDHANNIIAVQQSLASQTVQIIEEVDVCATADDALRIQMRQSLDIEVVRDYVQLPKLRTDRHKLLQILVNLISNARHALRAAPLPHRLEVRIRDLGERVEVRVRDTGIGIPAENMLRIFQYGFTAKKDGHGFGLHSCALHARSMGGSLQAHSDGPGQGATFTLELPWEPKALDDEETGPLGEQAAAAARLDKSA